MYQWGSSTHNKREDNTWEFQWISQRNNWLRGITSPDFKTMREGDCCVVPHLYLTLNESLSSISHSDTKSNTTAATCTMALDKDEFGFSRCLSWSELRITTIWPVKGEQIKLISLYLKNLLKYVWGTTMRIYFYEANVMTFIPSLLYAHEHI